MESPSIYLNYWADESEKISFQEILTWDLQAETLQAFREELISQLVSEKIAEIFPNIDWSQPRSFEKWEQFTESILLHISFPENVWKKWIASKESIEERIEATPELFIEPVEANNLSYLDNPFPEYISPILEEEDLLTAEVYFVKDELEESGPSEKSGPSEESKKVFESIQANDSPLFRQVETQLVDKLANSISLYQSIHFTKEIFNGDNQRFQQFIQFIDEQASPENWEQVLPTVFPELYNPTELKAVNDLLFLVEKKFN